jgi:DNA-binding XRE family transcriptional regulator
LISKATESVVFNNMKVFAGLRLACETQEAIADAVGVSESTVENWIKDFPKSLNAKELGKFIFQDDFQIPIYNVWKLQTKTNKVMISVLAESLGNVKFGSRFAF